MIEEINFFQYAYRHRRLSSLYQFGSDCSSYDHHMSAPNKHSEKVNSLCSHGFRDVVSDCHIYIYMGCDKCPYVNKRQCLHVRGRQDLQAHNSQF